MLQALARARCRATPGGGGKFLCLALLTLLPSKVIAQSSSFYDEPDGTRYGELKEWGAKYVELLESGVPAVDAANFAFTVPAMNSPLFSPVRAAMSIVGEAAGASNCATTTIQPGVGTIDEELVAYLTMGEITTSLTNTDASTAHLTAIMQSNNAQFTIQDQLLVSEGLAPSIVTTVPGSKQYTTVAAPTATWISQLGTLAPGWAAQRNFSEEGKRQLLGQVSEVDYFESDIRNWAAVQGLDLTVYRVNANFGRYGSLPVFVGVYQSGSDAGFILVDGINGAVDGPFVSGSAIDPRGLLITHTGTYLSQTGVSVADAKTGTCAPVTKTWEDTPPPGWTPTPATPGTPATQPGGRPSHWQDYQCADTTTGKCRCTSGGTGTSGTPATTTDTRVVCLCDGPCTSNQPGGHPNVPPPPITAPPGMTGCSCKQQYLY